MENVITFTFAVVINLKLDSYKKKVTFFICRGIRDAFEAQKKWLTPWAVNLVLNKGEDRETLSHVSTCLVKNLVYLS